MKGKIGVVVSVPEEEMIEHLSEITGHSQSLLCSRAISEWLQRNYRDLCHLYESRNK